MLNSTAFINLDFLPPKAERLCTIPGAAAGRGLDGICLRVIDNFPWSFDCRMKSDTAYDETLIDFVSRQCTELGLKLWLIFPGIDNFSRLLRLRGYRRMALSGGSFLRPDTEAVGFDFLIESMADDFLSLCSDLSGAAFEYAEEAGDFYQKAAAPIESAGCTTIMLDKDVQFLTAGRFLDGDGSASDSAFKKLDNTLSDFSDSVYRLRQFLVMSSFGCNLPAANDVNVNEIYKNCLGKRNRIETALKIFADSSVKLIEPDWLEVFTKSVSLTADEELSGIETRIRQLGLLN